MPAKNPVDELQKEFDKAKSQEDLAKLIGEEVASIFKTDPNSPFEKMKKEAQSRSSKSASNITFSDFNPEDEEDPQDTHPSLRKQIARVGLTTSEKVDIRESHISITLQLEAMKVQIERLPQEIRSELERG